MRKASAKTLKKKAWKAFARFIKARDSRENGTCVCCTCNAVLRWNESACNAGHFVCSRSGSVLFDEGIVHAQCASCNMNDGEQFLYGLFMKRKYGLTDEQLEKMQNRKHKVVQYKGHDYERIAEEYGNKADALIALKGI
jgi:hypothetical protein